VVCGYSCAAPLALSAWGACRSAAGLGGPVRPGLGAGPSRRPPSSSARRTQLRNDWVPTARWRATRVAMPTRLTVYSIICSTIRAARSRRSGGYRFAVLAYSARPP
jgi:hypothetical protein